MGADVEDPKPSLVYSIHDEAAHQGSSTAHAAEIRAPRKLQQRDLVQPSVEGGLGPPLAHSRQSQKGHLNLFLPIGLPILSGSGRSRF